MTKQTGTSLASIKEDKSLSQHHMQQPNISVTSQATSRPLSPILPCLDLVNGPRKIYLEIGVPLYEASIKCNWKAAKAIFDRYPDERYERYSITENGETALHVAASAKRRPKEVGLVKKLVDMIKRDEVEEFVRNLVDMMDKDDLALQNKNQNTALYLAAAAGNVKAVKIMVGKNPALLTIPGGGGQMMPLYAAALFGNDEVVKYLYENANELRDDGWTNVNRGWLLEKCVEGNMFDVALQIVEKHPELKSSGNILRILARKTRSFSVKSSNFIWRFIIWVLAFVGLTMGAYEKECKALSLLRIIWEDIAKKPKRDIDDILRGPPDLIKEHDNKSASGWIVQAMKLQKLIFEHATKMEVETQKITEVQPDSNQDTKPDSGKVDQALQLQNLISELLVNIHDETQKIIKGSPDSIKQDNKPISTKGNQAIGLQKLVFKHISDMHDETQKIIKSIKKEIQAQELQKVIVKHIKNMRKEAQDSAKGTQYSSRVLFIAAEMGNTNFLVELIRKYPDLIWKVNDNNQTIFHIAVKHRHEGIYNLLYEIGAMKDLITPLRDPKENNMLHLVGKIAKKKQLEDVSGVALQMQRELLWFKEVKSMIPSTYTERENEDGLTPHELFTKEHKDLVTQGEKWMKGTASQCMVVAALIATIVFAAAFTVPGGYKQDNDEQDIGTPVFRSKATFMVFVVADAISLFSSSASILMFLSILTSRYAERDFLQSLPKKLMFGLLALFLSITTMTVAFSVSFFVLYHKGLLWIPILIAVFAVMPVLLYMYLQSGLFFDVFRSTYRSRYLFKPQKHVLYYENPKV